MIFCLQNCISQVSVALTVQPTAWSAVRGWAAQVALRVAPASLRRASALRPLRPARPSRQPQSPRPRAASSLRFRPLDIEVAMLCLFRCTCSFITQGSRKAKSFRCNGWYHMVRCNIKIYIGKFQCILYYTFLLFKWSQNQLFFSPVSILPTYLHQSPAWHRSVRYAVRTLRCPDHQSRFLSPPQPTSRVHSHSRRPRHALCRSLLLRAVLGPYLKQ